MDQNTVLFVLELIGVVAFATAGVITALENKFDILGAVVLGLVTAVGGGILRDIILGNLPPEAFCQPIFSLTAILVSISVYVLAFFIGKAVKRNYNVFGQVLNIFDSIGLALFTITGMNCAYQCGFGENSYLTVFVGVLTGVGGGVIRDIMANQIPIILKKKVYAFAAFIGAVCYQIITEFSLMGDNFAVILSISVIIVIRILATIFNWNLPRVNNLDD